MIIECWVTGCDKKKNTRDSSCVEHNFYRHKDGTTAVMYEGCRGLKRFYKRNMIKFSAYKGNSFLLKIKLQMIEINYFTLHEPIFLLYTSDLKIVYVLYL